jgi:hypothetical protein
MSLIKRKPVYGNAAAVIDFVPKTGEQVDVYISSRRLKVGDEVTLRPPGYERRGVVVVDHSQNPRFQDRELIGGKIVNTAQNMYKIEVID